MRNATTAREKSAYYWFMENFTAWQEKFSVGNATVRNSIITISDEALTLVFFEIMRQSGMPSISTMSTKQIDSQDATDAWQVDIQESGASRIWRMVKRMCCPIQCVSEAGKVAEQE